MACLTSYPPVNYLDPALIVEKKTTLPPVNRSRTGYGSKLPTSHMVKLTDKRWYRVYVVCWSNSGTAYIVRKGQPHYFISGFDFSV